MIVAVAFVIIASALIGFFIEDSITLLFAVVVVIVGFGTFASVPG